MISFKFESYLGFILNCMQMISSLPLNNLVTKIHRYNVSINIRWAYSSVILSNLHLYLKIFPVLKNSNSNAKMTSPDVTQTRESITHNRVTSVHFPVTSSNNSTAASRPIPVNNTLIVVNTWLTQQPIITSNNDYYLIYMQKTLNRKNVEEICSEINVSTKRTGHQIVVHVFNSLAALAFGKVMSCIQ